MLYFVYNSTTIKITYCTSGFNTEPIMFTSRNQVQTLNQSEGLPIGQFDFLGECNYIDGEHQMCKNDILMIYTDGLEDIRGQKKIIWILFLK